VVRTSPRLGVVARCRLRWGNSNQKPVWNWIETTGIPTPAQMKTEVWMSLDVHRDWLPLPIFSPSFIEAGLLSLPINAAAVGAIDE